MFEKLKSFFGVVDTKEVKNVTEKDVKKDDVANERKQALLKAVQLWYEGRYERATELYKRYGITDSEFVQAKLAYSRAQPSSVSTQEKEQAVIKAVYLWRQGKYQRAVELYKRYGISDRDFSRYMVAGMRQEDAKTE